MDSSNDILICSFCKNQVRKDDEFCPHCGSLFREGARCSNHKNSEAEGVCLLCRVPYCSQCGHLVHGSFLCGNHEDYEIYEGMVRVYGVSDEAAAQYACTCLEQAGLHPFTFSRKASPISGGGPDYTLFRASGEYDGHIINEIKVMVPCQEALKAERILKDLDLRI